MGPFETIDLNAPGGARDYVERYAGIYDHMAEQPAGDWRRPVLDQIEAERRAALPEEKLAKRQTWRDRQLMVLAAHKRRTIIETGD